MVGFPYPKKSGPEPVLVATLPLQKTKCKEKMDFKSVYKKVMTRKLPPSSFCIQKHYTKQHMNHPENYSASCIGSQNIVHWRIEHSYHLILSEARRCTPDKRLIRRNIALNC